MTKVNKVNHYLWKDVLSIINGRDYKAVANPDGKYPIYGSGGIMGRSNEFLCPGETVVLGRKGNINNPIFVEEPFWNVDTAFGLVANQKLIQPKYLFYYCQHYDFEKHNLAVTIPSLRKSDLLNIKINLPQLEEQNNVCNILDSIHTLITLKQKQLKEFDSLEQSVFYKMFGDLYSEMKWKTSLLKDVITLRNGRAYKQEELLPSGKYKVLRVGNFFSNNKFYYSDLELEDNKYCNPGDLLYTWSASFGARIWSGERCIYHYHIWRVDFDENIFNKIFLLYMLNNLTDLFKERLHGVGMMHLTKQMMEEKIIPLPPLSLQQSFAQKIEVIEKQKEVVKNEIAQLQALLDSEMDKYFG